MRSLHDQGIKVVGADARRLPFGLHSRYVPPYERLAFAESPALIESLLRVIAEHRPDVLLPFGLAAECSQAKDSLSESVNLLIPDFDTFTAVNDKRQIVEQCAIGGIQTPALLDIESATRMLQDRVAEAIVVKPRKNLGGGEGVVIVSDAQDLGRVISRIESSFGEALISEFVPGPDSANLAMQLLFDRDRRLIGHFVLQKFRLQPPRVGITGAAVSVHRVDLLDLVLPLFRRLRWQGPADIEFKIDPSTGDAWLIEVNARFSGAVGFAIACGVNLPLLSCQAAIGMELPESTEPNYRSGIRYWSPIMYTRAIVAAVRQGESPIRLPAQVCRELRGTRVGNPYRLSDPAPMVGKLLQQIGDRFSRKARA
jgi:predicted ATP-grasp superfamily ATP-dependent carboligase